VVEEIGGIVVVKETTEVVVEEDTAAEVCQTPPLIGAERQRVSLHRLYGTIGRIITFLAADGQAVRVKIGHHLVLGKARDSVLQSIDKCFEKALLHNQVKNNDSSIPFNS
jgi:hypothetical protein